MSILFTTIPAFTENKSPKVVIIGAGLAGLTAAYRLQKEGMDVHLYEARDRVGGRIFTVKLNDNTAELGAQNIMDGGKAVNINHLIEELGLELTKSRLNLDHSYFNGENLIPIKQLLRNKNFNPQILRDELDELISKSHNMKEILDQIIGENDPLYKVIAVRLSAYEGAPVEKLSPFYAETLFHMLLGGISSAHQISGEEDNYIDLVSIKDGNALLPEKIAALLSSRLHLGMPLKQVAKVEDGSFELRFQDGKKIGALTVSLELIQTCVYDVKHEQANNNTRSSSISRSFSSNIAPLGT